MNVADIDGCRAGWLCVRLQDGVVDGQVFASFRQLLALLEATSAIAVDIPIGLPTSGERACDRMARQLLGVPRASSVFRAPSPIDHSQTEAPDLLAHPVEVIAPDAPIAERLTHGVPLVNSRHHQAIHRLADGFVPVALSPDGLVEAAVLDRGGWWVRAVQWHPENLIALPEQRSLWIDFIRAAGFEEP